MKTVEEKMSAIVGIALYLEAATALISGAINEFENLSQLLAGEEIGDDKDR